LSGDTNFHRVGSDSRDDVGLRLQTTFAGQTFSAAHTML
jgi:hypothetical protein